jgi:hypothetical protein
MKREGYKTKVNTPDEMFATILNIAAGMKYSEDQLRRTTRDVSTWVAKWTEFDCRIFEYLSSTITNLSFLCKRLFVKYYIKIKIKSTLSRFNFSFFIKNYNAIHL